MLTITYSHPISTMDDRIEKNSKTKYITKYKVGKTKYITKCDLLKDYWTLQLTHRAKQILASVTSSRNF